MARYLTVRARAINALKAKLESIQEANGYNTTVSSVVITRVPSAQPEADRQMEVVVTDGTVEMTCNGRRYEHIPIEIWFWRQRIHDQDREYSLFLADIQKCLVCPFQDPTHPQPQMTGIWMEPGDNSPLYEVPGDETMFGIAKFEMEIFYSESDPRLWDDFYDALVPVEE